MSEAGREMSDDAHLADLDDPPQVRIIHAPAQVTKHSRIWAVAAAFLALTAGIGLVATIIDREGWRDVADKVRAENVGLKDQVDTQSDQIAAQSAQIAAQSQQIANQSAAQQCRSNAAFDTDEKASELAITTALALAALARGESVAPYGVDLEIDAEDYRVSIDARKLALESCTKEPTP